MATLSKARRLAAIVGTLPDLVFLIDVDLEDVAIVAALRSGNGDDR